MLCRGESCARAFMHGLQLELLAQIDAADVGMIHQIARFAFGQGRAFEQDIGAVADAERFTDVVVGDQDGDAALGYLAMTGVSVVGLVLALMLWVTRAKPNTQLAPA